ncbi:MAG TPA: flotillin-like FloA family protein [Candidatus Pullichristensenella avicola]|nr:flotillin-like FloA family protein [Candidatus Pullichristensenella avicola]
MKNGTLPLAALFALLFAAWLYARYWLRLDLWLAARFAGAPVPLAALRALRARRIRPEKALFPYIVARKAGLALDFAQMPAHLLAGGDPMRVVNALILARERGVALNFDACAARDLAGEDPCQWVERQTNAV